jgi:hypothetical protein
MSKRLLGAIGALLLPLLAARAADLPEIREGLWESHLQTIDKTTNKKEESTFKICRSNESEKHAYETMKALKGCTFDMQNLGGGKYVTTSRCTIGGSVIEGKSTLQVTSTSSHAESHTTYTPASYGKSDDVTIQDQKYLGDCPAGTKPGQIIKAGGT